MLDSILILIILSLCIGTGVWLIFIWAVKKGSLMILKDQNIACWMTMNHHQTLRNQTMVTKHYD